MKKNITILTALCIATLSACGSKTDANEKNFGAAMAKYFDKKGDLCFVPNRWPVDLSKTDLLMQKTLPDGIASQMAALKSVGLVEEIFLKHNFRERIVCHRVGGLETKHR